MTPFTWNDRLVKLEGCLMFSRKGKHDDFEFFPEKPDDDMACAIGGVNDAEVLPDGRLRIHGPGGGVLDTDQWSKAVIRTYEAVAPGEPG